MFKFSWILMIVFLFSGCSNLEDSNNDNLYNAFEDDFFESEVEGASSNNGLALKSPVGATDAGDNELATRIVLDEYGEPIDSGDSIAMMSEEEASFSSDFADDNYIFSFSVSEGESLKNRMKDLLEPYGYKLVWKSNYEIFFENDVLYEDKLLVNVLKNISTDLLKMGIDLHINVYLKNKVVLVYSVRS